MHVCDPENYTLQGFSHYPLPSPHERVHFSHKEANGHAHDLDYGFRSSVATASFTRAFRGAWFLTGISQAADGPVRVGRDAPQVLHGAAVRILAAVQSHHGYGRGVCFGYCTERDRCRKLATNTVTKSA